MKRSFSFNSVNESDLRSKVFKYKNNQSFFSGKEHIFQQAWNTFDTIEEMEALKDAQKLSELEIVLESFLTIKKLEKMDSLKNRLVEIMKTKEFPFVEDSKYKGPHIPQIITLHTVKLLIEAWKSNQLLHPIYAMRLIVEVTRHHRDYEHTLNEISIPTNGSIVIVGDLHGQLDDLLKIFELEGWPSEQKLYLFNGDMVDRGDMDVQLLLTLYALKLVFPNSVFFNRGNHEQRRMNERYSFEKNCRELYKSSIVYELFQCSFIVLPLATLIDQKVLVIHGGLSQYPDVTIEEIKRIKRSDIPKNPINRAMEIFECLMWSDPKIDDGLDFNRRGAGILWGPDITHSFINNNKLSMIVRSHEMKQDGFEWAHDNKVLTIFSASHYCDRNDNKGAIAIFDTNEYSPDKTPRIVTFYAKTPQIQLNENIMFLCIEDTLQKLRETIFKNRHHLSIQFEMYDKDNNGLIHLEDWITCMSKQIKIPLNWKALQPFLTDMDENNMVNFVKFLDRFKIKPDKMFWIEWETSIAEKICQKIYSYFPCLEQAFCNIDKNSDQKISYPEFLSVIREFDLELTQEQVYDFMRAVDINHDGYIDFKEFKLKFENMFERFKLMEKKRPLKEKIESHIRHIANLIKNSGQSIEEVFSILDKSQRGYMNYSEFEMGVKNIFNLECTKEEIDLLACYVDIDNSGKITLQEFKKSFNFLPEEDMEMFFFVLNSLYNTLNQSKHQLRSIFYKMDIDGSGTIDKEEFVAGLKALKIFSEVNIQEDRLISLFDYMDVNKDGCISYEEFLNSFKIVDVYYEL